MNSKALLQFLLNDDLAEDDCDSDVDPPFIPPPIYEVDLDFDEYSDGDIEAEEKEALLSDLASDLKDLAPPPEEVKEKEVEEGEVVETEKATVKTWLKFVLFDEIVPEDNEDEANDRDFRLPIGVEANLEDEKAGNATPNEGSDGKEKGDSGSDQSKEKGTSDEDKDDAGSDKGDEKEVNVIPEDEVELLIKEASEPIEVLIKKLEEEKKSYEEEKLKPVEPQQPIVASLVEA